MLPHVTSVSSRVFISPARKSVRHPVPSSTDSASAGKPAVVWRMAVFVPRLPQLLSPAQHAQIDPQLPQLLRLRSLLRLTCPCANRHPNYPRLCKGQSHRRTWRRTHQHTSCLNPPAYELPQPTSIRAASTHQHTSCLNPPACELPQPTSIRAASTHQLASCLNPPAYELPQPTSIRPASTHQHTRCASPKARLLPVQLLHVVRHSGAPEALTRQKRPEIPCIKNNGVEDAGWPEK
jgi:hypothetical protein